MKILSLERAKERDISSFLISSLAFVARFICAGGWYGGLLLFDDPLFHPSSSKTPTRRTDANSSDFNALEHSKRNYTIVTGSSDGEICSWKCDLNSLAKVSINDSVHVEEEAR